MIDNLLSFFSGLPKQAIVFFLAALPISELRGAIPAGVAMQMPLAQVVFYAILGNLFPVIPLLLVFKPIADRLRKINILRPFFDRLYEKTRKKALLVEKYESLGLILFVAVPLPITGAWTGCLAASLFKIRFRYAFFAITAGVFIASFIVTLVVLAGQGILYNLFLAYR